MLWLFSLDEATYGIAMVLENSRCFMKMVLCNSKSEGRAEGRVQRKRENKGQTSHRREDCNI